MKKTLSNQFLADYLVIFLLTITATFLAFVLLSAASGIISASLAKNKYPASSLMRDDYNSIEAAPVTKAGGGVQVINSEFKVVYSRGLDVIGTEKLSAAEWTDFLIHGSSRESTFHHDILYNPQGEFWLVVTFPTSIRIDFAIVTNKDAVAGDKNLTVIVIASVLIIYFLVLALITYIFSRIKALGITRPLRKLNEGTKLLREGDYSVRVDLNLENEFAELQDTFNDMAARIEREMSLRKKSESDRRRLILDISHDLKNPLASISGYAQLCLEKPELAAKHTSEYMQIIFDNSQRANLLLNEMFELSQLDSPEFKLRLEKTDLSEQLRVIAGELVPTLDRAGFIYSFDIPAHEIAVLLDQFKFSRIIHNLAENTLRYNSRGTKINISLTAMKDKAVITFSDNGRGIPASLAEEIFKPFVRADVPGKMPAGSGLGLSIAKKIAIAHGGDLELLSGAVRGCAFEITLPLI